MQSGADILNCGQGKIRSLNRFVEVLWIQTDSELSIRFHNFNHRTYPISCHGYKCNDVLLLQLLKFTLDNTTGTRRGAS